MKLALSYILITFLLISCTTQQEYTYDSCSREFYEIPSTLRSDTCYNVKEEHYTISEIIPLSNLDENLVVGHNVIICNDRIYINEFNNKSVLVFDHSGKFLFKVGEVGHSKSEIIGVIENFDVDRNTDFIHIYNREGRKILVYDENGRFNNIIRLYDILPSKIVIADNGNYIGSNNIMSTEKGNTKLSMLNTKGEEVRTLFESYEENNITCEGTNTNPLFSDHKGHISYLPMLADSLIMLEGDSVQNIIKFVFDDKFPSNEDICIAKHNGDLLINNARINYISKVFVNDYYVFMEYFGRSTDEEYPSNYSFVFDKVNNMFFSNRGNLGFDKMLGSVRTIHDDYLVCLITEDDVNNFLSLIKCICSQTNHPFSDEIIAEDAQKMYNVTCQNIITGKIKTPVLLKIKLR